MMHDDLIPGYRDQAEREEMERVMEEMRGTILEGLTRLEKAALFEEYDEFWHLYWMERGENV